jgi:hypothetical protein
MSEQRRTRLNFDADLNVTRLDDAPAPEVAEEEFCDELFAYLAEAE